MAQLVEHVHGKHKVGSAILPSGSECNKFMAIKKKPYTKLQCTVCKKVNYYTNKSSKKNAEKKLELKKFCPFCKKHTVHKEGKR